MKKTFIFLALVPMIFLCACAQSSYISVDVFSQRVNDSFGYDIFDKDKLIIISENNSDVYYWFPEGYDNICVSLNCTKGNGVITEYSAVYSGERNKRPDEFFKNLESAVSSYNKYITFDEYKSQNGYIKVFSDSRFTQENSDPTMKREISNDDVTFPVLEDKTNNNDD